MRDQSPNGDETTIGLEEKQPIGAFPAFVVLIRVSAGRALYAGHDQRGSGVLELLSQISAVRCRPVLSASQEPA